MVDKEAFYFEICRLEDGVYCQGLGDLSEGRPCSTYACEERVKLKTIEATSYLRAYAQQPARGPMKGKGEGGVGTIVAVAVVVVMVVVVVVVVVVGVVVLLWWRAWLLWLLWVL